MGRLLTLKVQQGSKRGRINSALQGHGEKVCSYSALGGDYTICMIALLLVPGPKRKKIYILREKLLSL